MSRCTTVLLIASLMLAGCSRQSSQRRQAPPSTANNAADYLVGEPIHYANLSIFPVTSPESRTEDRYTTLNEGLRDGTVEVFEIGSDTTSEADVSEEEVAIPSEALNDNDPFGDTPGDPSGADPFEDAAPADSTPADCDETETVQSDTAPNEEPVDAEASALLDRVQAELAQADSDAAANEEPIAAGQTVEETLVEYVEIEHLEALEQGSAEVNRVMVINRSGKPLYLMPGEIIMGGDQDRCVGKEYVIAPGDKPVPVEVFCVEHGRWGGRASVVTQQFAMNALGVAEESVAFASVDLDGIATASNEGKFVASIGSLNAKARLAVQASKDQAVVWESVEAVNVANGIDLESGAFTGNYTDEASLERLAPYHEALLEKVPDVENVIGVVVAINGKVQTMDLFESTPLFRKLWPKLLKSYALDAANSDEATDAKARCTRSDAIAFLQESMSGDIEDSEVLRGIATTRRATDQVVSFAAEAADDARSESFANGLGGGGFGSVHTSAFSK